ncbi:MAG TPA: HAD family hydrolase [Thermoleophilaceae bacterium]|nr:HAD family hydrolase [Thermoleophilaceae bacterium]
MSAVRCVTLDVFGTLVELDSPAPLLRAEIADRTGVDVGEERAAEAFGAEISYYLAHHLEGSDMAGVERLRDRCAEEIRRVLALDGLDHATARAAMLAALRFRAFADALPLLRALRDRGVRVVAASNWDASLPDTLERTGLAPYVDGAVSSAVVGAAKPDPAVFRAALAVAGCEPGAAYHAGDSPDGDVAGAQTAGIRVALLDRDGVLPDPPGGVPKLRSLDELPSVIWPA